MADEGAPIGFAPVAAGEYPPGEALDKRIQCLFIGARIRREVEAIREGMAKLAAGHRTRMAAFHERPLEAIDVEIHQSMLNSALQTARKTCAWDDESDIGQDIRVLEAVRPVEDNVSTIVETADRLLAEFKDTENRAIAADPPLLRNVRRYAEYNATRARREEK